MGLVLVLVFRFPLLNCCWRNLIVVVFCFVFFLFFLEWMQPGSNWKSPVDACVTFACVREADDLISIQRNVQSCPPPVCHQLVWRCFRLSHPQLSSCLNFRNADILVSISDSNHLFLLSSFSQLFGIILAPSLWG